MRDDIALRLGAYNPLGFKKTDSRSIKLLKQALDFCDFIGALPERDDISKYPEDKLGPLSANGQFGDLREANPSISGDDGSILAYAKAMCHWHAHSEHCSVCGSFALSSEAGHTRKCSNVDCAVVHFPRTDSAVIVAVTFEDKILLGRQAIWPKGMLSVYRLNYVLRYFVK